MTVHVDREGFNTSADVEKWASGIPVPTYALDDQTAVKVTDGSVEVISEGNSEAIHAQPGGKRNGLERNAPLACARPQTYEWGRLGRRR